MSPDKSKELLSIEGSVLIERAVQRSINPLLLIRKEKGDLIEWADALGVDYMLAGGEGEWADTVLESYPLWDETNVLMLPDTIYNPQGIIRLMAECLKSYSFVIATHAVTDLSKWGAVLPESIDEKPQALTGPGNAWGLLGFNKAQGRDFLTRTTAGQQFRMPDDTVRLPLFSFQDVTRTRRTQ